MTVIGFYGRHCLSNFSDHAITINNEYYPTVEHYFQTMKFVNIVDDSSVATVSTTNTTIAIDEGINSSNNNHATASIAEIARCVRNATTPDETQALVKQYKQYRRADWSQAKDNIMLNALQAKLETYTDVRDFLLSTGQARLVETSPVDDYWGIGADGQGLNKMGQLWMTLRTSLLHQQS